MNGAAEQGGEQHGGRAIPLVIVTLVFLGFFAELVLPDVSGGRWPGRNLVYRDAGHFYYPYFRLIASEWGAGRAPLWNPYEDCGQPLAANPTASVFYPGKLLFLLPYPIAFKWYHLGHLLLALVLARYAARRWGASELGGWFAGVSYAFGSITLFQIYNVVFLVGAAWLPLALVAIDRCVRSPSRRDVIVLAMTLALQVLGGDPEIAYLVGVSSIPYALLFHLGVRRGLNVGLSLVALGYGAVQTSSVSAAWEKFGGRAPTWSTLSDPGPYMDVFVGAKQRSFVGGVYLASIGLALFAGLWGIVGGRGLWRREPALRRSLMAILAAGSLAALLSMVQILPTFEFTQQTDRAAPDAPHEPVAFSVFPARAIEFLLPSFFGRQFPVNSDWAPMERLETGLWVPTLYVGFPTLALACWGIASLRDSRARWLSLLLLLMFWMALGKFGGPRWLFDPRSGKPVDPLDTSSGVKAMYGESDGLYRIAEEVLPGFRAFRFPSKMLVLVALSLSLLSGLALSSPALPRSRRLTSVLALATILLATGSGAWWLGGQGLIQFFQQGLKPTSIFGPFDAELGFRDALRSLIHGAMMAGFLLGWLLLARGGPIAGWRGHLLLALLAADLLFSLRWLSLTDLQSEIDREPQVARIIREAEQTQPKEPFRVHRTRIFDPPRFRTDRDPNRMAELSRWERGTIQPKYGVPWNIEYTQVTGTMSLYDLQFFFAPWVVETPPPLRQRSGPARMTYFPRVGYNVWNTKYFVLPRLLKLDHDERGSFTLLSTAQGGLGHVLAESPPEKDDFVVMENSEAYPRAWVVHALDIRRPIEGLRREDRQPPMEELLFRPYDGGLPLWSNSRLREYPFKSLAMVETSRPAELAPFTPGGATLPSEKVRFEEYVSNRVIMSVTLSSPGVLVLADAFYPGWSATVDGVETPMLRVNRAMRGTPLGEGEHRVVMTYSSAPLRCGAILSGLAWLGASIACFGGPRPVRPKESVVAPIADP